MGSKGFRLWLRGQFYKTFKNKAPNAQALQDALGVLESRALFDGPELSVHVRVAHTPETVFVDLGTPTWEAVEITARGWQVVADPPVKFRRPAGLAPLPAPERDGTLEFLRPFFNIRSGDWPLIAAWLTACFSPGPYPILVTQGEQGSSKSTLCRMLVKEFDSGTFLGREIGFLEELRRKSMHDYAMAKQEGVKLGFLRLAGEISAKLTSLLQSTGLLTAAPQRIVIEQNPFTDKEFRQKYAALLLEARAKGVPILGL